MKHFAQHDPSASPVEDLAEPRGSSPSPEQDELVKGGMIIDGLPAAGITIGGGRTESVTAPLRFQGGCSVPVDE